MTHTSKTHSMFVDLVDENSLRIVFIYLICSIYYLLTMCLNMNVCIVFLNHFRDGKRLSRTHAHLQRYET